MFPGLPILKGQRAGPASKISSPDLERVITCRRPRSYEVAWNASRFDSHGIICFMSRTREGAVSPMIGLSCSTRRFGPTRSAVRLISGLAVACWGMTNTAGADDRGLNSSGAIFSSGSDRGSIVPAAYGASGDDRFLLRARGGMTYLNRTSESHVGGTYGLDGILPLSESLGGHAAARVNQFSGGTQLQGTVGAYRSASLWGGGTLDRIGGSVLIDLFGDLRGSDVFLSQLRAQAGYAVSADTAVGVTLTHPLNEDRDPLFLVPGMPNGTFRTVTSGGVFVSQYLGDHLAIANIGVREDPDSLYIDAAIRTPLIGDSLFAYANGNYIAQSGDFSSWVGLEFRFGRSSRGGHARGVRSVWDDPTIANSFNYGENSFWHNTRDTNAEGTPFGGDEDDPPERDPE